MNDKLSGRLILADAGRKFSRLGVFEVIDGQQYLCFEKISTSRGDVAAYMTRTASNEGFVNTKVGPGDIVELNGSYGGVNGNAYFIAEAGRILSKCEGGRKSAIFGLAKDVKEATLLRSKALRSIRGYFDQQGFAEVSSPILLPFYEGGDADPFRTVDKGGAELFLKETNELILRRLISCGIGPVYEIGRSFRNIGTNKNSLSEFSVVESAIPHASLPEGIDFAEGLLKHLLTSLEYVDIDVGRTWKRLRFEEEYQRITGQVYVPKGDYLADRQELSQVLNALKESPAFLIGLPHEISPINSRGNTTLNESVLVIGGDVYCDVCDFEVSKRNLEERLARQNRRTKRDSSSFLKFADQGLVPGVGIAFGIERWLKQVSGKDITALRNLGGVV